jgi:hypothetical protein
MRLLDIILTLSDQDRRDLSSIAIDRNDAGEWIATLSISRMQPPPDLPGIKDDLRRDHPEVSCTALMRVPDQEHPIDLEESNVSESVRAQAIILQESGLVGKLDMAKYDRATRTTGYKIKTHAGSQAERTAWATRKKGES